MKKSINKAANEKRVRICPKCGSIDIHIDFSNPVVWAYGTTTKYKCNSCNYTGNLFPYILKRYIQDYKKRLKQKFKEGEIKYGKEDFIDTSTGFSIGIWEIILLLVASLVFTFIFFDTLLVWSILWSLIVFYLIWRNYKNRKDK